MTVPTTGTPEAPQAPTTPETPATPPTGDATPQAAPGDNVAEKYLEQLANDFIKDLPEQFRDIIPQELTPQGKIDFIRAGKAKGLFSTGQPQDGPGAATPARKAAPDYTGMNAGQLLRAGLKA